MKIIKLFLISFLMVFLSAEICAQTKEKKPNQYLSTDAFSELDVLSNYYKKALNDKGSKSAFDGLSSAGTDMSKLLDKSGGLVPIDGFIDPEKYYIGPSDVLEVNIWGAIPVTIPVIISPEGSAILNMVGEVVLRDLTLAQAKEKIVAEVKKKFKATTVSVTLRSPRVFSVAVVGNVNTPGSFVASALDRIDRVVTLAVKKPEKKEVMNRAEADQIKYFNVEEEKERNDYSLRNIKVFRKNGDTLNIDLIRYFSMGDFSANPYLRDGDVIFIPKEDIEGNYISIFGAVKQPGKFEFCRGDKITTAVKIAQGLIENSDLKNVELNRANADWTGFSTSVINLKGILDGKEPDIELLPGDRIFLRPLKTIRPSKEVTLKGEILKQGKYPIIKGVTKLSEIIEAAGGFTKDASLAEAKIIRKNFFDDEVKKNPDYERLEAIRLGKLDRSDIEYFTVEEAIKRGYVVADFKKLFIDKDKKSDIVLEGDEIIYVPTNNNSVYVYGQVNNPGYLTITGSENYEDYIKKAGGFGESALENDVAIIKGGSKEWKDPGKTKIESGDIIWVPKKNYRDFNGWWEIVKDVSSFIVSAGTLALIIIQIQNNK